VRVEQDGQARKQPFQATAAFATNCITQLSQTETLATRKPGHWCRRTPKKIHPKVSILKLTTMVAERAELYSFVRALSAKTKV
jgi:hypothetical protein